VEKNVELIDVSTYTIRYISPFSFGAVKGLVNWVGAEVTGTYFAPYLFNGRVEPRAQQGIMFKEATGGERCGFHKGENRGIN
jgi:hypothetical protein